MDEQKQANKESPAQTKTAEQTTTPATGEGKMSIGNLNEEVPVKKVMIDDTHKYTNVVAKDYKGPGGAHHHYIIHDKKGQVLGSLDFQDGPIKEAGVNGVMDENLLAILIDRLKGFQSGVYQCAENAVALSKCSSALVMLKERTKKREASGKEGTHKV